MRTCPVCSFAGRSPVWSMTYQIPDGWPLPGKITWFTCDRCSMIYGDGNMSAEMFAAYYSTYYGYGLDAPDNVARLKRDAAWIAERFDTLDTIVDFGGGDGIIQHELEAQGFSRVYTVNVGGLLPRECDLVIISHVLEHLYEVPGVMGAIVNALSPGGLLIVDGPDSTGMLQRVTMPILDYHPKHINHFTLRNYLELGRRYGLELTDLKRYELTGGPAYQMHFRRYNVAQMSADHVAGSVYAKGELLKGITYPVNVWGLGDTTWHILSQCPLDVLDYIDNDPAFRGQTYGGKPVLERPTNDEPIVILAQGQRAALIRNIRAAGIGNEIVEV